MTSTTHSHRIGDTFASYAHRIAKPLLMAFTLTSVSFVAYGQDDDLSDILGECVAGEEGCDAVKEEVAPAVEVPEAPKELGPVQDVAKVEAESELVADASTGKLQEFVLDRGAYAFMGFGGTLGLGGVNGTSAVQPHWNLGVGHDIGDNFGVQATFGGLYILDNAPFVGSVLPGSQDSYSMTGFGLEGVLAVRPSPRFAIQLRAGGGGMRTDPILADDIGEFSRVMPYVDGGIDFQYLTLMTGFSAGAGVTYYYVLEPGISALGIGAQLRHTF